MRKFLDSVKKGVEFVQESKGLIEEAAETLATLKEELDEAKDSIMTIKDMATSMFNNDDDTKTEQNKEQNDVPLIAPKQKGNDTTKPTSKQADTPIIAEAKAEDKSGTVATTTKHAEFVEVIEVCNSTDSKKEDTFFEDTVGLLGDTVSNTNPQNPTEVVAALSVLAQAAQETTKYVLEQEVKREEIRAKKEVAIHQINAISEGVKLYLEKTFDERSAIFSKQFECIDEALKKGDNELLAITLNNINSLATSSPFKNLADINSVQHALGNGDTEWDI